MATRRRSAAVLAAIASLAVLAPGCARKDNPNYCPGLNRDDNCAEGDAGVESCTGDGQCAAPAAICDTAAKVCVQCTAARTAACTGATPICGADDRCRGCASHADCSTSNVCLPDGSCADPAAVAYVSAAPDGTDNTACSLAMPCARIMKALDTGRPYLKLRGSLDEAITINDRSVTMLAEPGTALTRTGGGNIVTVGGTSNVQIYDLDISGASGIGAGVSLPSGSLQTVTLDRVSMTDNNGMGGAVLAQGGTINLHRSRIVNNTSGGISISMAQFDIANNFITGNGDNATLYGGILLNQANTGTRILRFNTISANKGALNAVTGVLCDLISQDLTASDNIVYGNTVTGAGMQAFGMHCLWTYSDIGPGAPVPGTGNLSADPGFVPGDFHLSSGSPVIDQADPGATLAVDIDGDARPQGARRDLGADEYAPPRSAVGPAHARP